MVYKPDRGQQPLWDFDAESLSARETLTYEVSAAMGIGRRPRDLAGGWAIRTRFGQRWVDEDIDADPRPLLRGPDERLWPIAVLDLVCNNADRKLGHVLIDKEGRLWAIDHGLTFHPLPKLRTVLWGFSGDRLPPEMVQALQRLCTGLDDWLGARVADLLGSGEEVCLRRRVERAARQPDPPGASNRPPCRAVAGVVSVTLRLGGGLPCRSTRRPRQVRTRPAGQPRVARRGSKPRASTWRAAGALAPSR